MRLHATLCGTKTSNEDEYYPRVAYRSSPLHILASTVDRCVLSYITVGIQKSQGVLDEEHNIIHSTSSALGEIKLEIFKAKLKKSENVQATISDAKKMETEKLLQTAMVHERSKKAVDHHVQ